MTGALVRRAGVTALVIGLSAGVFVACAARTQLQADDLIVSDLIDASDRDDVALELTGEPRVIRDPVGDVIQSSGQPAGSSRSYNGFEQLRLYRLLVVEELRLSHQGVPAPFLRLAEQRGLWCAEVGFGSDSDLSTFCPTTDPWFVPPLQREVVVFEFVLGREPPTELSERCEILVVWGLDPSIDRVLQVSGALNQEPVGPALGTNVAVGLTISLGEASSTFGLELSEEGGFVERQTGAVAAIKGNRVAIFAPRSEIEGWESYRGSTSCGSDQATERWEGTGGDSTELLDFSADVLGLVTIVEAPSTAP